MIDVGGEEGQLGAGRGFHPPDDEPHRCGVGLTLKGDVAGLRHICGALHPVRNRRPVLLGYDLDEIAQAFMLADGDGEADIQFSADGDHGVGVEAAVGLGVFAHDVDGSERCAQDIFAVGGGWLVPALVFDGCWGRSFQSTDAFVEHQGCRDGFRFVHLAGFSYQCRHIGRGRLIWPHNFMSLS